jgi:hypothetical protein
MQAPRLNRYLGILPVGQRLALLILPLFGVAMVLATLVALGQRARDHLRSDERYQLPFTAIDCGPPPGLDRLEFLAEVQYLANFPDKLSLLEDNLNEQLANAFAQHPWVEQVDEVKLGTRSVEVRLRYRIPVLAVKVECRLRAVDAHGILLPAAANTAGLPVFSGTAAPPAGPAGTPWGDEQVQAAARAAAR